MKNRKYTTQIVFYFLFTFLLIACDLPYTIDANGKTIKINKGDIIEITLGGDEKGEYH